jgi:Bifunctional DNA primase/polymerase, N-terminal
MKNQKKPASRLLRALELAARGRRVFPLHNIVDGECSCGTGENLHRTGGKHPRIESWPEKATTEADKIKAWLRKWPNATIGIALDIDGAEALAVFKDLMRANSLIPKTVKVRRIPPLVSGAASTSGATAVGLSQTNIRIKVIKMMTVVLESWERLL